MRFNFDPIAAMLGALAIALSFGWPLPATIGAVVLAYALTPYHPDTKRSG